MKNLIGNKNFYHIYLAGNFDNIYQYHEKTNKQLENEMEQKKRCNINAYKCTKYSISQSYLVFFLNVPTMCKILTSSIRELKKLAIVKIDN